MLRIFIASILALFLTAVSSETIPNDGLQAEGTGQWEKAVAIYLQQLSITPKRSDLWVRIGEIEHRLKNYELAIDAYQHALLLQPNNPDLHKVLSEIYAETNQPNAALNEINTAVSLKPTDVNYLTARARIANWNNKLSIALESYQRILQRSQTEKVPFATIDILMQIAQLQSQLHQYTDAIKTYQQAININPNNPVLYQNLSQLYASLNQPENALLSIDQALKLDPTNVNYLDTKAKLAKWGKKTAQLSPFDQLINEANTEALQHHYGHAANAIKKAIKMQPNNPILYKKLSEIYALANQKKLALSAINMALKLQPNNLNFLRTRAQLASWALDKIQARDSYERILIIKPDDEDALLNLAHVLAWQGKTDAAIKAYQRLLFFYPRNAEGWLQYAEVKSWTGNYLKALYALECYKQLKGPTFQYRENKARILALVGRYNSALALNNPLLQSHPKDPYILTTEVTALLKANQTNNAMYYLNKIEEKGEQTNSKKGIKTIARTPVRTNINFETDNAGASDTTRIADVPITAQYYLTNTTSLLMQGLYEQAAANPASGLGPVNGGSNIADETVRMGLTSQIAGVNLKGLVGGLKIEGKNSHAVYDVLANTNIDETMQFSFESLYDLFRPYLVPQTPRLISLQVLENRFAGSLQWQPFIQKYLYVVGSYSNLSDNNDYVHLNIWPKSRVFGSERWLVTIGADGDYWHFARRATDGYYSPIQFVGGEGTVELYYTHSENIGYSLMAGFGAQKDETFPHYFYEEDLAAQLFFGIFADWELQVRGGYTLRENPAGNYHYWASGFVITRRFR